MTAQFSPAVFESATETASKRAGFIDRTCRKLVFRSLEKLDCGRVTICEGNQTWEFGRATPDELSAIVFVHSPRLYRRMVLDGANGVADSYLLEEWESDHLVDLLRIFVASAINEETVQYGSAFSKLLARAGHFARRNSRLGSRRNIAEHYDLSNDFFALWLDGTMSYSAGIFESPSATLADASRAKNDRMCRKLALKPTDHLLEIGTGWGEMAIHAAKHYGCRVTTTTISEQQYAYAKSRVEREGLSNRIELLKCDYRDLTGQYDKIVTVEMIEAVGHEYYGAFFKKCRELLKPDGAMMMQAITIADEYYETARRDVDFIKQYIFPGCCIPSVVELASRAAKVSDLRMRHLEDITPHYAETLARWRSTFLSKLDEIRSLGFDDRFIRMWDYYFAYCEAGFRERHISDVQMLFVRPQHRGDVILPSLATTT